KPGSSKKIALGVCESYRTIPGLRAMEFHVEGAPVNTVDPLVDGKRNQPLVAFFDAKDVDSNGVLEIEARPSSLCKDPNVILNAIWVFPPNVNITAASVISGAATKQAEIVVDCGKFEMLHQPTRFDALLLTNKNSSAVPVVSVQSDRALTFDSKSGTLTYNGNPFVISNPKFSSGQKTEKGWELELPVGTNKAEVIVANGFWLPKHIAVPDLHNELKRTSEWWLKQSGLPAGRITIPDEQIQYLFDASVRTMYQNRDTVDGYPQFQPGSTVYRGLWLHDGVYYIEAAALLGDTLSARRATEELFTFQEPNGRIRVIFPVEMIRETPMFLWTVERYARLANNADWLRTNWMRVVSAMKYIRETREQTLADSSASYYGLMPPGFVDGGIAGLTADYSTVFWTLIGIHSAVDMARWLGKFDEQQQWQTLYNQLLGSFRVAARRDVRHDKFGHPYLPVRVADTTTTDVPQRAQWAICEAMYLSEMFSPTDSVVLGSLALIDSTTIEGLPSSFGWMTDGVGVWFAPLYGLAHFAVGHNERAADILYAFANHSTPHGAWAEEQMPKGVSTRTTGDYPTTSATAGMLRSVLFFLAYERGNTVEVLRGAPVEWLKPGLPLRAKQLMTTAGRISFDASIAKDGKSATLVLDSYPYGDVDESMAQYTDAGNTLKVFLTTFKKLGFKDEAGHQLPDHLNVRWGHKLSMHFQK
ncbi:MAG: hypothetical protein ABI623_00940, partial [bacterium]